MVDINLNFFNDILYSVRLKNISKLENMEFCATKQRVYFSDKNKKASYKIINYGDYYDVDYYDNNLGNDSNLLIVFYVQIMPDDFVMQLHRF